MMRAVVHTLAIAWLLPSALLPSVLAVLDARAEAAAASVQAHVEQLGGTECPEAHDADCAICTTLRTGRREAPAGVLLPAVSRVAGVMPPGSTTGFRSAEQRGQVHPRGPPTAA